MNDSPAPKNPHDLSGRTLGAYHLIYRLGRGGMAEVYLANQESLKRKVAIKVLRLELAKQPDYVKRFHNEAQAAAALVHANIVQIYEVGCVDGIHFIAQEYVSGQTVKQLVARHGALPIAQAVSILRQMTAALGKAGQGNIVHRDIKPENILLTPDGEVKVADFGLARVMDPQNVDLTQAGLTMGTPLYMSPEQVEGRPLDHRSDLYSCGVTAFFMLSGRPPFEGETPLSVAVQHLNNAPPALSELRPDAPAELVAIVARLLEKKAKNRFANAGELLSELRQLPLTKIDSRFPVEDMTLDIDGNYPSTPSGSHATQQLRALMATQAIQAQRRPRRWWLPIAVGVSCLLGIAGSRLSWSGASLDADANITSNQRLASVDEQYWHALRLNTVEAWTNVGRYFPPEESRVNTHHWCLAQRQLAWLYLSRDEQEDAKQVYENLTTDPKYDPLFRTIGHAGLTVIYAEQGNSEAALAHMRQAWPDRSALRNLALEGRWIAATQKLGAAE